MTDEQAAAFWTAGANHLASMCAQCLHHGDVEAARVYARRHDRALHRAIMAASRVAAQALRERPVAKVDWFGEG